MKGNSMMRTTRCSVHPEKDFLCNVQEKARIPLSWILLDNQSTVDVFCNLKMLHNVWEAK